MKYKTVLLIYTYFQQNSTAKEVKDVRSVHSDHWLIITWQTLTELKIHKNPDGITFQRKRGSTDSIWQTLEAKWSNCSSNGISWLSCECKWKKMKWEKRVIKQRDVKERLKKKCNMQNEDMNGKVRPQPMEHGNVINECLFLITAVPF